MVEKEMGERNYCFDSLKSMNPDMEEKGIVAAIVSRYRGTTAEAPPPRHHRPVSSMSQFGLLQIDVEVEGPEMSENPTQSFEIHNIVWRHTQLLAVILYLILL